jgi:glycosyltransferase involved in cell wall biosynthesis
VRAAEGVLARVLDVQALVVVGRVRGRSIFRHGPAGAGLKNIAGRPHCVICPAMLQVRLDVPPPPTVPAGHATAIFVLGSCFHHEHAIERLELVVDGEARRPTAFGMPRLDLYRALDGEPRSYRSGFWATVPIAPRRAGDAVEIAVRARLGGGGMDEAPVGRVEATEPTAPGYSPGAGAGSGLIAVCMATYDPDPDMFRTQIASLREQTDTNWTCVISDDRSAPERVETIERTIGDDSRFTLRRADENVGFYRNFERALEMVPAEAELVALCDQDDRWYPDKLATLRAALRGGAQLAYSDTRLVDSEGRVLAPSLWERRRNNHTSFASMLIANTVPGAASVMRREVVERALPFPDAPGDLFHDHWLAVVAMAGGELSYVDRPLYDYVQHIDAVQGKMVVEKEEAAARGGPVWRARRAAREFFGGWRTNYFRGYVPLRVQVEVLGLRSATLLSRRKRRALGLIAAAERSPLAFAWLALRPLRAAVGRGETLGAEEYFAKGVLWRCIVALRTRRRETPRGSGHDSGLPPEGGFEQKRLRRWRALQ